MALVRILTNLGFENAGDIVNYRGADLDELLLAGSVELLEADPRPVINTTNPPVTPVVAPVEETEEVETVEEVEPVVEGE